MVKTSFLSHENIFTPKPNMASVSGDSVMTAKLSRDSGFVREEFGGNLEIRRVVECNYNLRR